MSHSQAISAKNPDALKMIAAIIAVSICVMPMLGALAPRALGFAPAIIGLSGLSALRLVSGAAMNLNRPYFITILITVGLAGLSGFWSLDPDFAFERSGKIAFVLAGGLALFTILSNPHQIWPRWMFWLFPLVYMLAGLTIIGEFFSHGLIHHALRATDVTDNKNFSFLNRAIVTLSLLGLPAILCLAGAPLSRKLKLASMIGLCAVMVIILIRTDSQSAQLAALVTALFWYAFPYKSSKAWIILGGVILSGILASPWLVQWLYKVLAAGLHDMPWFSSAYAADRLEIWDFVARKALENPLFGFGIEATRHTGHFDTQMLYTPNDHVLHPHNAILQIWIEFGLLGVLGLCAFMCVLLHIFYKMAMRSQNQQTVRLPLTMLMAVLSVSCSAYGFWQGWWLGLLTVLAAFCACIVSASPGVRRPYKS